MSNTVRGDGWADVELKKAFEYVANGTNTTNWFYGVTRFEPVTDQLSGLGARFNAVLNIGMPIKAVVECTEYIENEYFVMKSVSGPDHQSKWSFTVENGGTRMTGEFTYTLPGGLAGKAMGKLAVPFIKVAVSATTKNLQEQAAAL